MAEQGAAQNKLGELFVELGSKGAPTLLKQLNSVSALFLLGKNAATQFVQTLSQPFKEAGKSAVEIGKMSTALGLTFQEYMRLHLYLKSHNLSDALISDMASVSDMLTKVSMGIGGISGEFAYAMHRMGLSWTDYDGSFKSIQQLTKDVQNATEGMDAAQKRVMLQSVGLSSPEWQYAFERENFNLDEYKTITDEQVNELIKTQESMANLGAEFEQLKMHLINKLSPAVQTIADWSTGKVQNGIGDTVSNIVQDNAGVIGTTTAVFNPLAGATIIGAGNLANMQEGLGGSTGHIVPMQFGAAPLDFGALRPPSNISPNTTINITNNQKIEGANAQEIADKIGEINMQNIEYSQYQVSNLAGI